MFEYLKRKYFKPGSLTWLASVFPLLAGIFIATTPIHHMVEWSEAAGNLFGTQSPTVLINAGLIGIGVRGSVP